MRNSAGERVAVYIAGNSDIFFPALVALDSIQKMNLHLPLDMFVIFDEEDLSQEHVKVFAQYGISFVPTEEILKHGTTEDLPLMKEGQWPAHVFHNWIAPLYFSAEGYKYAIKADYDLLCMSPYRGADIFGFEALFHASVFNVGLANQGVTAEVAERNYVDPAKLKSVPYFNVGFAAINLDRYRDEKILDAFKSAYSDIVVTNPNVPNAEQAATALLCLTGDNRLAPVDPSYNVRTTTLPKLDANGNAQIRNLHYLTHNKPWRKPNYTYISGYVPAQRTCIYIYRDAWLQQAASYPGFEKYVETGAPDALTTLGVLTKVLAEHYRQGA